MSAAIAMVPSPAPHDRSSYVDVAPSAAPTCSNSSPSAKRITTQVTTNFPAPRKSSLSPKPTSYLNAVLSGNTASNQPRNAAPPKIVVKKEPPSSPELSTPRHRPRKLDLSKNTSTTNPATSRPSAGQLTARTEGGPLAIQDVGLACLSPGFQTQDPTMREQLQRSISVREQQRHLIELRLQQSAKPGDAPMESAKEREVDAGFGNKTPAIAKRKVPPGLSIVAPPHEQFAQERVIQSAPLNQSFTGRHQPQTLTRHITNQQSNLSNTSHIHHVPAIQTSNRLPPITDFFSQEGLGTRRDTAGHSSVGPANHNNSSTSNSSHSNSSHSSSRPTYPSPGQPSAQPPLTSRTSYVTAEDALVEIAGGRTELLPRIVHYGGHQPPTPPSPPTVNMMRTSERPSGTAGKKRCRAEFEETSPQNGSGTSTSRRMGTSSGEGSHSPSSTLRNLSKKAKFLKLCEEIWDLLDS